MAEVQFRPAKLEDIESIRACIACAYEDAIKDIPDLPDVTEGLEDEISNRDVVVAETSDGVVGVIVFGAVDDAMMVFNLAVSPNARGQGLARRLMKLVEENATARKISRLRLRTHQKMHGTIAMYTYLGWVVTDRQANGLTMEKDLPLSEG